MTEEKKSLEDLEQIYAKNKNFQYKPDLNYDKLKISKEELRPKSEPLKYTKETDTDFTVNNRNLNHSNKKRDEFIEMKSFLPTATEKMISSRYENPLSQLQRLTSIWRKLALALGILSIIYLLLNLIATLADTMNYNLPEPISRLLEIKWEMQDTLFLNETATAIMDIWGIVTYVLLVVSLLRDRKAHMNNNFEEKSDFEKKSLSVLTISVVLFGLVYAFGILYEAHGREDLKSMVPVVVFYLSKVLVVLVIAFVFKKYKATKFVYEDLMFEALESSDDEESGEMESE